MTPTEKQYVEKLKVLIEHLMGFVYEKYDGSKPFKYLTKVPCKLCNKFTLEINSLEQQIEAEEKTVSDE
jgi:hypothetical protein